MRQSFRSCGDARMSLLDVLGSGEASSVSLVGQCHDSAKGLSGKWQLYPLSIFYIYFSGKGASFSVDAV